jgi:hypothetical protein
MVRLGADHAGPVVPLLCHGHDHPQRAPSSVGIVDAHGAAEAGRPGGGIQCGGREMGQDTVRGVQPDVLYPHGLRAPLAHPPTRARHLVR